MSTRPRITRVVLENYRNIEFCDVRLGRLAFLVGPNGSGKSNFLEALRLLSECMHTPVNSAFERFGGFANVMRIGAPAEAALGIRMEFAYDDLIAFYSVRFSAEHMAPVRVDHEECLVEDCGVERAHVVISPESIKGVSGPPVRSRDRLYLGNLSGRVPEFRALYDILADGIRIYEPDPVNMRNTTIMSGAGTELDTDAENSAVVIARMQAEQPAAWQRVQEFLRQIVPQFAAVEVSRLPGTKDNVLMTFMPVAGLSDASAGFLSNSVSQGTLRALAVLVALYQSIDGGPPLSLVGIEEPENSIHPGALEVLLDAIREASKTVQVIATSHSADLLDHKEIETDALLAVEEIDGVAHIGPVDISGREILRKRLYTPGEMLRSGQLRPQLEEPPSDVESVLFSPQFAR